MNNLININDIKYSYTDNIFALNGINLDINEGGFVAILGHNGSGKSTLATHLNAIKIPSLGTVYVAGMDTRDENLTYEIRKNVAMVFQNPDNQIVATVVEEDVAFALENLGIQPPEIRKRVDEALELTSMSQFTKHAPHMLSGGQKQRVAIASVIAMKPKLIVLDEPTAMLDPRGREEVMNVILNLCKTHNITFVLITHHMEEAVLADRVIVMNAGKILLDGTPRQVFLQTDILDEARLETAQTVKFLKMLNDVGLDIDINALTIDECVDILEKYLEE